MYVLQLVNTDLITLYYSLTRQALHKRFPSLPNIPTGKPGTGAEATKDMTLSVGKKASDVLGIKYESLEDTVAQIVESVAAKGWLKV
jgi:hypothetical protein